MITINIKDHPGLGFKRKVVIEEITLKSSFAFFKIRMLYYKNNNGDYGDLIDSRLIINNESIVFDTMGNYIDINTGKQVRPISEKDPSNPEFEKDVIAVSEYTYLKNIVIPDADPKNPISEYGKILMIAKQLILDMVDEGTLD